MNRSGNRLPWLGWRAMSAVVNLGHNANHRVSYLAEPSHWRAELELWFARNAGKTRLMRRRHVGPLVVQQPFHPEKDGTCHVYILHPPAGLAGGDRLDMDFHLDAEARAVLTTPGATKFYRSEPHASTQSVRIHVGAGATCEYLPQESIIFDGAEARLRNDVSLSSDGTYVGWDFICLGRPAANERFETGRLIQRTEIRRAGRPIWIERIDLAGGSPLIPAPFVLAGQPTWGTMIYAGAIADDAADKVREAVGSTGEGIFSVSQMEEVVVCRYLGPRVADGKRLFVRAWDALRMLMQNKAACAPRIWAT